MNAGVLQLVYPPDEIFIVRHEFDDDRSAINVTCRVPSAAHYTNRPIPYVTAENYVRCLSQTSYLLAEHLLAQHALPLEVTVEDFRSAAVAYQLYYRNLAMTFHALVRKDEEFPMRLTLKDWRELHWFRDFILFVFANKRTVISGEMSFVCAKS